jgi:hypothetical protein
VRVPGGVFRHADAEGRPLDESRQTLIICGSCNRGLWGVGSATNSRSRCAALAIAHFIAGVMKWHGGSRPTLIPQLRHNAYGSTHG